MRFIIILVAVWGFALYFFYDGAIGYKKKNAAYFSYTAFAEGGQMAKQSSAYTWGVDWKNRPLLLSLKGVELNEDATVVLFDGKEYPIPSNLDIATGAPEEFRNHALMSGSWNDAWKQYSSRMRYPLKPAEKPYDVSTINEQWIAGGVCVLLGGVILYFIIRTSRRTLSISGDEVKAAGRVFKVDEITSIDLRQWGPGYKGAAFFVVSGKKIKVDGMTYGGFDRKKGEPADQFMKSVLAKYSGDIIEYAVEQDDKKSSD